MDGEAAEGSDGLAIAAVARALEIPIPTIRSWERRYGFPRRHGPKGSIVGTRAQRSTSSVVCVI
jgi:hypothetical protein